MKKAIQTLFLLFVITSFAFSESEKGGIAEINSMQFKQKVWNYEKSKTVKKTGTTPIILDFHATWCKPCKMLAPHLQAIQNKYKNKLIIYKIDVDKEPDLAKLFNVEAMPTIIFINQDNKLNSELGYKEYSEFETLVKKYFLLK